MTTVPDVAVVATLLARTDRRALSQAWYSALHLAHETPAAHAGPPHARNAHAHHDAARRADVTRDAARTAPPGAARAHAPASAGVVPLERRQPASAAVRRVERAIASLARTAPLRPSHTVAIEGGRVTLLVRTDARATRIVAVCRPALRATVERALAHARFVVAASAAVAPR